MGKYCVPWYQGAWHEFKQNSFWRCLRKCKSCGKRIGLRNDDYHTVSRKVAYCSESYEENDTL